MCRKIISGRSELPQTKNNFRNFARYIILNENLLQIIIVCEADRKVCDSLRAGYYIIHIFQYFQFRPALSIIDNAVSDYSRCTECNGTRSQIGFWFSREV